MMTRRKLSLLKRVTLVLTAGVLFGGMSCVTAADLLGTGLSLTGALTGTPSIGPGLDLLADLVKYTPLGG
ncbi:MAG: hypothetical protein AABZ08_03610 [Planctomycetota bacterium]